MFSLLSKLNNKKGFTLVELMVVVVIIGILVAIIIPIYGNVQDNAAMKSHEANLRTIDGAITMYIAEEGQPPKDIDALVGSDYLTEVPTIPKRIASNADKFLQGGQGALVKPEGADDDDPYVYELKASSKADGEMKAFPVPMKNDKWEDAYRAGDTEYTE